ncbi:histidine phosphatase family protein [Candidatus Woesearchaeota archaeon]|nr:histidine phosphatase family protein [Candidatus Woesearchaeota archaeon]
MRNKVIRHAESIKLKYDGKVLKFLSESGIKEAIEYGKKLVDEAVLADRSIITPIITSPQIRAIETGYWISYGFGREKLKDWEKDGGRRNEDKRIDVANFLSGYSPHQVGCQKAYQHLIEHTPEEVYTISQRFASFVVSKLDSSGVLAVSHDIPMSVFLYALGINEINSAMSANLQGFSFGIDSIVDIKHPIISVDGQVDEHGKKYLVEMDYLEYLIQNKANCRLQARRLD